MTIRPESFSVAHDKPLKLTIFFMTSRRCLGGQRKPETNSKGHLQKFFFLHLECPQLPYTIQHGNINGSGRVEGSLHRLTCNDGYSLVGEDVLSCTQMGQWNASVPICLRGNTKY